MSISTPSDIPSQNAADIARRMVSKASNEAEAAWDFAWQKHLFPQWAESLCLLPCILVNEYSHAGLVHAQRWVIALATHYPAPQEDLGDRGLSLAFASLKMLNETPTWREAETQELERVLLNTWIERLSDAGTRQYEFRLKRLVGLARVIGTFDSPTASFALQALQQRYAASLRQGLEVRHELEYALEGLLDALPNEILLAHLSEEYPEEGWGFTGLEYAFFLRGTQAPIDELLDIACSSRYRKASRACALRSLRLLGESGSIFPVEPLIDALDNAELRAQILWVLSTQGTRVPAAIFQRYLADQDAFLHRATMAGLTAFGRPDAREMLLKALQDEDRFVRTDAIKALCRPGEDIPVESIIMMMHDSEPFVRREAISALRLLEKHAPVAALVEAMQEKNMLVRQDALDVLVSLKQALSLEQLLSLLQARARPFSTVAPNSVRRAAIRGLGKVGGPVAVQALQEALEDNDPHVVLDAVKALQQLEVQPLLQPLLTHPSLAMPRFRPLILRAMSKLGEPALRASLLQPSQQAPIWVQVAAVEVLAECDTADAAEPLRVALREKNPLVQLAAMAAMSKHPDLQTEIPLDRLFSYLHSQNTRLQGRARHALWSIGPQMDVPEAALLDLLEQPVGFPLAHVLGENCRKLPLDRVGELLTSPQPRMRTRAIELLGKRGEDIPIELLVPMLQDEDGSVRFISTETLGTLGSRIPVEALTERLQDEEYSIRKAAIEALAKTGERAPLNALIHALDDEEGDVAITATRALLELQAYQPLRDLIEVALHAEEPERQYHALINLIEAGVIDHFAADIPLEPCVRATNSENEDVRQYAAEVLAILARHGRMVPAEPLLALMEDQNDMVCGSALKALSILHPPIPSELFLAFLDDERNYPRMCAIGALGTRGEEAPIERILSFLTLRGPAYQGVRSATVEALSALGERAPREALLQALHDEEAHIRWQASEALKQQGTRIPLDLLEPYLYHSDEVLRRHVLDIIKTCRPDAFSQLARTAREKLMTGEEGEVSPQHLALFAEAAGYIEQPSPTLLKTLIQLFDHADQDVRSQAALALARLQQPLPDVAWQRLFAMYTESKAQAVRHAATRALHELLSRESGPSDKGLNF